MSRIAKLADRLVDRLAPRVTADAACIILSTSRWTCTASPCFPIPGGWEHKRTITYDNCPPRTERKCLTTC